MQPWVGKRCHASVRSQQERSLAAGAARRSGLADLCTSGAILRSGLSGDRLGASLAETSRPRPSKTCGRSSRQYSTHRRRANTTRPSAEGRDGRHRDCSRFFGAMTPEMRRDWQTKRNVSSCGRRAVDECASRGKGSQSKVGERPSDLRSRRRREMTANDQRQASRERNTPKERAVGRSRQSREEASRPLAVSDALRRVMLAA